MAVALRAGVRPDDRVAVRRLVASTGFFTANEEEIAVELVEDALAKGESGSGYHFLFAEDGGHVVGYVCFGPIAGTAASHDLYWIVVDSARRGGGVGRVLERACVDAVKALGGLRLYVDTSSRSQYEPTRAFYRASGYEEVARLKDFYAAGDGKVIFVKALDAGTAPGAA
ncbi:MAG: GNAT family N-acetyltransferase [Alphaproteobacteria bacterium]|nr:GNAT family N-acetyltransferase [Alphaproteobacteria bacterium]